MHYHFTDPIIQLTNKPYHSPTQLILEASTISLTKWDIHYLFSDVKKHVSTYQEISNEGTGHAEHGLRNLG